MGVFRKILLCSNWPFTKIILVALCKCSQGEDGSPRKCVITQVRGYDDFTKGSLIRDSKEETIFKMAGEVS